jgi:O-succinylbenzoic acid--CoA ligase
MIDWNSERTELLLNPRFSQEERFRLHSLADIVPLESHVWVTTSGSTGSLKLTALSKQAILASADAVNRHLGSSGDDVWLSVLPQFHVGGLGVEARAFLTGARVVEYGWDPQRFVAACRSQGVTLSALVPAHVHDLVAGGFSAPGSIRAIVVGGGRLDDELYAGARELGWPLLPSYGLTEACSQVATASLQSLSGSGRPDLEVLQHVEVRREESGLLALRGPSLLTGYALEEGAGSRAFVDPKVDGWFVTEDRGVVMTAGGRLLLRVEGRGGEFVKIGGESVDLIRLQWIAERLAASAEPPCDAAIVAIGDARLGSVIHLVATCERVDMLAGRFNEQVLPFERARAAHRVSAIPRTPLRKLLRADLTREIEQRLRTN